MDGLPERCGQARCSTTQRYLHHKRDAALLHRALAGNVSLLERKMS